MEAVFGWAHVNIAALQLLLGPLLAETALSQTCKISSNCSGCGGAELASAFIASACLMAGVPCALECCSASVSALVLCSHTQ